MTVMTNFLPIDPIIGEPDIDESYIRLQDAMLLKTLLIDRTKTALNRGTPVDIKWAIDDYANEYLDNLNFPPAAARRFAEIVSWNIWQVDGIKFVVPNTCHEVKSETPNLDGTDDVQVKPCEGCDKGDVKKLNGVRSRVMDGETGKPVLFMQPFEFKPIEEQEKE